MVTGHVFAATSLDGYLARSDHSLDWLPQKKGEDSGYESFVSSVDGIVMGRYTFEKVMSFDDWPYHRPVIVMSRSGRKIPDHLEGKVRIVSQTPTELFQQLKKEGWKRAYIDGGELVSSFLREGLIQELVLTVIPILLGDGRRLFGEFDREIELNLLSSKTLDSKFVQLHYEIASGTR